MMKKTSDLTWFLLAMSFAQAVHAQEDAPADEPVAADDGSWLDDVQWQAFATGYYQFDTQRVPNALQQLLRRDVDQLDGVRTVENGVGDGLAHLDAGDLRHHVVQALEVLHVQRGEHVDAGVAQLFDVLPALRVPRARRVGVRQLVHQHHLRSAQKDGVHVQLEERASAMWNRAQRHPLEPGHEGGRVRAPVVLDDAHDHVAVLDVPQLVGRLEHAVGLAHTRGEAEEDLEPPAACALLSRLHAAQQLIGVGSVVGLRHRVVLPC